MRGIEPGNYRIRRTSTITKSRNKLRVSYPRVTLKGEDKYFQIDNGIPYRVTEDDETFELNGFEILDQITDHINYHHPKITVRFKDNKGYEMEMEVSNLPAFNNIMELFPGLKKALSMKEDRR